MQTRSHHPPKPQIRGARPGDEQAIHGLIAELAEFEQLTHLMQATPERLAEHLFGPRPVAESAVAEVDGTIVAFALWFTNYSTFLARPGLYLEDLYVQPPWRGRGIGRSLLIHLAALAQERGCGRFEWSVLDWNAQAIGFYERLGATLLPDWRICRVTGESLGQLARGAPHALTRPTGEGT